MRERVEVVVGSHSDPDVVERAVDGADAVFWLVPPNSRADSIEQGYTGFTTPGAKAFAVHGVTHVVGVSALGRGTPVADSAGLVTQSLAVDDLIASTGVAYRALACAGFMDNLLRQVSRIRDTNEFSWTLPPETRLPLVATADVAAAAAALLLDRSWTGVGDVPLLGPEYLTPQVMAATMSQVLGRPIRYREQSLEEVAAATRAYATEPFVDAMVAMMWAKQNGLDDTATRSALSGTTTFKEWSERILHPQLRD
jgi:uncharacterized protein YbjT (DUF2867 family)